MIDFTDGFIILAFRNIILYFDVTKYIENEKLEKEKPIEIYDEQIRDVTVNSD